MTSVSVCRWHVVYGSWSLVVHESHCITDNVAVDISLGDNPTEPRLSLLPGRRRSTDVLQRQEHLSVSQRLPPSAAAAAHGVMVIQFEHDIIIIIIKQRL